MILKSEVTRALLISKVKSPFPTPNNTAGIEEKKKKERKKKKRKEKKQKRLLQKVKKMHLLC